MIGKTGPLKRISGRKAILQIVGITLAMGITTILVALSGTSGVAVHLFYIPIIYAGFVFGDLGAIVAAAAAGLLCGPWMPAQIVTEGAQTIRIEQTGLDIVLRTAIFYVVGIFASRVSYAIERQTLEMRTLYEVARTVSSSLRLREVLDTIAHQAISGMDARGCSIRLFNPETGELDPAASAGLSEQYWAKGPVTLEASGLDQAVMEGEIVSIRDPQSDPRWQYPDAAEQEGLASVLSLPLRARDSVLGVMRIYAHQKRDFSDEEIELLSAFAHGAAVAIENAELYEESRRGYFETVRALTIAIEARDAATYSHSERVTQLADDLAKELGMSEQEREILRFGGILHDIGKIGIEERMLDARDTDDAEHVFYRMHPLIGRSILKPVSFADSFLEIVVHHHERWDGRGFPEGLEGDDIPFLARLLAVVDAYELAVNPTESPMPVKPRQALRSILRGSGSAYDPEIVSAFSRMMQRRIDDEGEDASFDAADEIKSEEDVQVDIEAIIEDALNASLPDINGDAEAEER